MDDLFLIVNKTKQINMSNILLNKRFIKNHTYMMNHENIFRIIDDFISTGRLPTILLISETTTGLTRKTVYEHLKSIPLLNENKELVKMRRNMLLEKLYPATQYLQ